MKKSLLISAMMMAMASAYVFADGSSSITGANFGGYSTGNEINSYGGFCSGTGGGTGGACGTSLAGVPTLISTSGLLTTAVPTGGIATLDMTGLKATTGGVEAASGAGITNTSPFAMAPITAGSSATKQGTYTGMQAVSLGAYHATSGVDPTVNGNTSGSVYALQKPDLGIAQTSNTTSSIATATKGQAATWSGISSIAQAVNPVASM
jgi:hypothetical protein